MNTVDVAATSLFDARPARWPAGTSQSGSGERPRPVTVVTSVAPSTAVVGLQGEHDIATAAAIERTAGERLSVCDRLVVDLAEASFIDSSVINALARLARQARSRGVMFQVVAPSGSHPRRVLDLMGLDAHLGCVDGLRELGANREA